MDAKSEVKQYYRMVRATKWVQAFTQKIEKEFTNQTICTNILCRRFKTKIPSLILFLLYFDGGDSFIFKPKTLQVGSFHYIEIVATISRLKYCSHLPLPTRVTALLTLLRAHGPGAFGLGKLSAATPLRCWPVQLVQDHLLLVRHWVQITSGTALQCSRWARESRTTVWWDAGLEKLYTGTLFSGTHSTLFVFLFQERTALGPPLGPELRTTSAGAGCWFTESRTTF
jgi:hypothetical protein